MQLLCIPVCWMQAGIQSQPWIVIRKYYSTQDKEMNITVSKSTKTRKSETIQTPSSRQSGLIAIVTVPTQADIAMRAYDIYISKGRQQGQAERDWLEAEKELRAKSLSPRQSPSPSNAWPLPASEGGDEIRRPKN
jgi:hypothetical protein